MDITVTYVFRKKKAGQHSIETLFRTIGDACLGFQGISVSQLVAPFFSDGVFRRLGNIVWAGITLRRRPVVHITGDVTYIAIALRSAQTVVTIHDGVLLEQLQGLRRWIYKVVWLEWPCKMAGKVTTISNATADRLKREFPWIEPKLVVIPNAVSPAFSPSPKLFDSVCPRVLQIGTKPNKNLQRVIEAIAPIRCTLHVVGHLSIEDRQLLERRCVQYDNAVDISEEEMVAAYNNADLVMFASTSEGFGMPIIEAQVVERPVITSNCSSMPEVAGEGACLVDPFSVTAIREAVTRIVSDKEYRDSLIAAGRRNRSRFELREIAAQYTEIYSKLGEDRPRNGKIKA